MLDIDDQITIKSHLPYTVDEGISTRAMIALLVLATDQTIEYETRKILNLPGVGLYQSRLLNDARVNEETLRACAARIPEAAGLILPGFRPDVVGFGCTSATMMVGDQAVTEMVHSVHPGARVSTPITAAFRAFDALRMKRIALLTPYPESVNRKVRAFIVERGYAMPVMGSFNEDDDRRAARISEADIKAAVLDLGASDHVDGVFVSCTSLRLVDIVEELEAELGKPVTSSNHAMAWDMLRLARINDKLDGFGRLLRV